jgi:hypothetical protein
MTVPKRFGVLRFFGTLFKVIAWIVLVIFALIAISVVIVSTTRAFVGLFTALPPLEGFLGAAADWGLGFGIGYGILTVLAGLVLFLFIYVLGELIHMYLAVEENTRLTAALLLRMHQEGQAQQESSSYSAPAAGGFVSEPYE